MSSFLLPPEFERAVLDRVRSGRYASAEDVLHALVDALEEREADEEKPEVLRRDVKAGLDQLDQGESRSRDEVLARLRKARPGAKLDDVSPDEASSGLTVTVPAEWIDFIEEQILGGHFASPEMVVEAGLVRLLGECEADELTDEEREELRRELQKSLESLHRGDAFTGEEAFDVLRADRAEAAGDTETSERLRDAIRQRCGIPLSVWHRVFVDELVRSGRYASPREVLETALNVLREAEASDDDEALAELRREIDLGFESGDKEELIPGEEVEARILARWRGGAR